MSVLSSMISVTGNLVAHYNSILEGLLQGGLFGAEMGSGLDEGLLTYGIQELVVRGSINFY
jgi:hypothetical protein